MYVGGVNVIIYKVTLAFYVAFLATFKTIYRLVQQTCSVVVDRYHVKANVAVPV